jgi:anti-sigma-K factor RskA
VTGEHPDRDDIVAFALGALEPQEARAVQAHAPGCARCKRELEALVPAVAVLGESVEQLEPPPELRERVLAEVHADVARTAAEREAPARRPQRRGWRGLMMRPALAVGLAIVIAAVGGYVIAGNGGGGEGGTEIAVKSGPAAAPGAGGSLAVSEDSSTLDLHGLRQLTGNEVYQVWIAEGANPPSPSSSFTPDRAGRAMTAVDGHLTPGTMVMLTKESGPGHTTPTPPILLSATVQ